jgi:uncharacterized protein (TIRG00374 family)
VLHRGELERLAGVLRHANWVLLPLAVASEAAFQCNEATIYWVMYRILGYRPPLPQIINLTLAASFVNRMAPSAGLSGTTLFAERMARSGIPAGRTVTVNVARYMLDYGAFLVVLCFGMLYLSSHHELTRLEVRAAAGFGAFTLAVLGGGLVLVTRRAALVKFAAWVGGVLGWVAARLGLRRSVKRGQAAELVEEILSAVALLARARGQTAALLVMAFFIHIFDLLSLLIVFAAMGHLPHLGVMIAGYGLAYLAGFVSLVPSGLGVFEASMTAVYVSLGIPLATAAIVTLVYRLVSLWLPLLAGYLAFHLVLRPAEDHAD